jgi:hypothetical protein
LHKNSLLFHIGENPIKIFIDNNNNINIQLTIKDWNLNANYITRYEIIMTTLDDDIILISNIIENFMQWLLGILGFLAIVAFTISGIQYLTAAGNEDQISTAKRNMTWSIVGVVVALMGFIIIIAIDTWLSGFSTTF